MNLSIQSPKANAFFNTAALHTTRSAQTSPSPAAQSSADTFERGIGRGWQTLISNANSTTSRSAGLDSPSLDTPELGPSKNGFGLGLAGFGGMGVSQVDALDPSNKGTAMGSQAVDAGEEDATKRMLDRATDNQGQRSTDGVDLAYSCVEGGATMGLGGFMMFGPAGGTAGAFIGCAAGMFHEAVGAEVKDGIRSWLDSSEEDTATSDASDANEEVNSCQPEDEQSSYADPTREPMPSDQQVEAEYAATQQAKPSDPTNESDQVQPRLDVERMARQRQDHRTNWGPDGEATPSDAGEDTTPALGPCGPDSPTPSRPD